MLDAGALVGVDRGDRTVLARLKAAQLHGIELRTNAMIVAQVWRDPRGRQASLAGVLNAVDIRSVDEHDGRHAGVLCGAAGTSDPIDASLVLLAMPGDRILTGDPGDLGHLAKVAGNPAVIIAC